ncbi:MAG: 2-oxo acid dehydrogenase subunit E2 [Chloroflexi bacterium]|nr:2-oxo acid dehydrogenase subunit E2 [Chloroflexota bacterium]
MSKWLKRVGDQVEKYEPLAEVVTDKVTMEMPSPASGTLTAILVEEGQTVPMGTAIAEMQVEGAEPEAPDVSGPRPASQQASAAQPQTIDRTGVLIKDMYPGGPTGAAGPLSQQAAPPAPAGPSRRRRYSPAVTRLAEEHEVDLDQIEGTGINGRVTRKDVQRHIEAVQRREAERPAAPAAPSPRPQPAIRAGQDEERLPLTPIRRIIAENMVRSATQIPQAWTIVEADVTGLVRRRGAVRDDFQRREGVNITYLPFVVKAVAEALKENPLMNASWGGDAIILKRRVNIGIAVAARDGLVVPVIRDADTLSVAGLAKRIDDLTNRARQGRLTIEDVQGGTFTVNNTGALGSVASQPLVNPPQAGILTTEAIVKRPIVINDAIAIRSMMNLCLTFDHRVMDGAEASAFISSVKRRLEAIGPETGIY